MESDSHSPPLGPPRTIQDEHEHPSITCEDEEEVQVIVPGKTSGSTDHDLLLRDDSSDVRQHDAKASDDDDELLQENPETCWELDGTTYTSYHDFCHAKRQRNQSKMVEIGLLKAVETLKQTSTHQNHKAASPRPTQRASQCTTYNHMNDDTSEETDSIVSLWACLRRKKKTKRRGIFLGVWTNRAAAKRSRITPPWRRRRHRLQRVRGFHLSLLSRPKVAKLKVAVAMSPHTRTSLLQRLWAASHKLPLASFKSGMK